jgi:hypothetical protein
VTVLEPQGPGWAFALFAAAGQELGPIEVEAVPSMARNVSAHAAILRTAVNPSTEHTGVFAAGTYPAADSSKGDTP